MPYLYCEVHGTDRENRVIAEQGTYREAGESVLVVSGKLISGPWRCDSCNATLRKGNQATLCFAFARHDTESMFAHGFAQERRFFAMRGGDSVAVYGAAWPGGNVAEMVRRAS